jgi:hypothetical protein
MPNLLRPLGWVLCWTALATVAAGPNPAPFVPNNAATVTVAVTTTSGSTAVALVGGGPQLTITSAGSATAFCEQGASTVTAAVATGFPVMAGVVLTIGRDRNATHVACITAASTATVYYTTGDGS